MRLRHAVVSAALVVTSACSLVTSFDGFDEPKDVADGAADADAADASPPEPCARSSWPPPKGTGSASELGDLVAAVRSLSVVSAIPERPHGHNLDGLCSCPERTSCRGAKADLPCDPADSGVDNGAQSLFSLFVAISGIGLDDTGIRIGLDRGRFGVVLRLSRWNGETDDPSVQLAVLNAVDVEPSDAGARFDGRDTWVVDDESLLGGRVPTYPSTSAYVSGGVLVASLPRLVVKVRIPTVNERWLLLPIELRDAHVTGELQRDGAGFALRRGTVSGRVPTSSFLEIAASAGVCPGSDIYKQAKPVVCEGRDVPLDPSKDGRDVPCEAVSFGLGFEASAASIASTTRAASDERPCADAGPPDDCP